MAIDFAKWNQEYGGKEAVEELKKSSSNDFQELPDDTYACKLEKLELAETKAGKPMIKGTFRIQQGKFKRQCLFWNQVFTRGFPQHKALEFLRSLKIFDDIEVDFNGDFEAFNDLLLDMAEEAEANMTMFNIKKSKDGEYTRLDVMDVYD